MGFDTTSAPSQLPISRLVGVGLIVFLANAALLVLQLVAGRLLAPFIGSSLETWTSVIGVFLLGIALGNGFGGKLADRYPSARTLATVLGFGSIAAVWMAIFPHLIAYNGIYKSLPLGPRIPLLALGLCLPAGFVLSLLTPLAIKLGIPDLSKTGRVAGMVFALSTLGCLLGNYLTGFILIPSYTINMLVFVSSGTLLALSIGSLLVMGNGLNESASIQTNPTPSAETASEERGAEAEAVRATSSSRVGKSSFTSNTTQSYAFTDIRMAYVIVFLASFGGMTLELTASRVLAEILGVSLFTWTGIIGVMLAGTALGNFVGGIVADRVNRPDSSVNPRYMLAGSLLLAAAGSVFQLATMAILSRFSPFQNYDPITQVMCWTFCLFFLPMFALGTISPQVIRLSAPDVAHIGRVAGRVYAWSTTGAIVGTFMAGYLLLSALGMKQTILVVSLLLVLTSLLVAKVWEYSLLLYMFSVVLGGDMGCAILIVVANNRETDIFQLETNYYTIRVVKERDEFNQLTGKAVLHLDHLIHSTVDTENPFFIHYTHEYIQMEFLTLAQRQNPNPRVLVVGGGGYTFPRYALEAMSETRMDVVEIDPGVTWTAKNRLGLKDYPGLKIHHMDGRQYIAEKVPPGTYDLVVQDAVNDLSVPSHLLTKEYNDAVKAALKPNGVYLLTVIDSIGFGKLWKAAMHTLEQTYPAENIALLTPDKMDPTRFNLIKNKKFEVLQYLNAYKDLPSTVVEKLEDMENREFSHAEFHEELTRRLDRDEQQNYLELIEQNSSNLFERQVLVIYASDRPVDINALHAAVTEQLGPAILPSRAVGTMAGGLTAPGGMSHALVTASLVQANRKDAAPFHTYRIPPANLQPYLDAPPKIILTDQFAPVDNLMADVFRFRYRQKPKR